MPKVLLLQFNTDPDREARREIMQNIGATVVEAEPRWPSFFDVVTAQRPDVILIACGRLSSYAFECARYLGDGFNTRNIPVYLMDVSAQDLTQARSSAPRASIVDRVEVIGALRDALNRPISS